MVQPIVEAEFIDATAIVNQALWLKKIVIDLHMEQTENTKVFINNQAAIAISSNLVFHGRTKHFNIKLYFLKEVQEKGEVCLQYCKSKFQLVDIFTKAFPASRFKFLRKSLEFAASKARRSVEQCA